MAGWVSCCGGWVGWVEVSGLGPEDAGWGHGVGGYDGGWGLGKEIFPWRGILGSLYQIGIMVDCCPASLTLPTAARSGPSLSRKRGRGVFADGRTQRRLV